MYTRTRAQRRCSYKKEKEGKLSHVCEQPDSLVRFEGGKQSLLQININTIERGVTRPLLLYCKTGFRVPSTLPAPAAIAETGLWQPPNRGFRLPIYFAKPAPPTPTGNPGNPDFLPRETGCRCVCGFQ
jgi:hypothetical protein